MATTHDAPVGLPCLPGPCLLAVMQHCADDPHSLFSAARAHPTLHQASFLVLKSINWRVSNHQQLEHIRYYLCKRGQHVNNIILSGPHGQHTLTIRQFPPNLKLQTLNLKQLRLRLQPGVASQGVLRRAVAPALKQLCLERCMLLDGDEGLAAALVQLTGLEHLSLVNVSLSAWDQAWDAMQLHAGVVQGLQALTYLELAGVALWGGDPSDAPSGPTVEPLTQLVDVRLGGKQSRRDVSSFAACVLSGASCLTRLEMSSGVKAVNMYVPGFDPAVLEDKPHLQHLELGGCALDGSVGVAQLLSALQQMQELTHLGLSGCLEAYDDDNAQPPAAAYSALTASSKLQHLDISGCLVPEGVLQHVLPSGRQLPNLRELNISALMHPTGEFAAVPDATRLANCCPGMDCLRVEMLVEQPELLPPLQQLSGLRVLHLACQNPKVVGQMPALSGLQQLSLTVISVTEELSSLVLLPLTGLRRLTQLDFKGEWPGGAAEASFTAEAPGDEPVWRQLLKHHLDDSDPEVAQQAAAALAGSAAQPCSS